MQRFGPLCYGVAHGDRSGALGYVYIFIFNFLTKSYRIANTRLHHAVQFPQQKNVDMSGNGIKMKIVRGSSNFRSVCEKIKTQEATDGAVAF